MISIIKKQSLILCLCFAFSVINAYCDDIEQLVQQEIDEQISNMVLSKIKAEKATKKYDSDYFAPKIHREIKKQAFRNSKNYEKQKIYENVKKSPVDDVFVYKLPAWPFYSIPFMQKDIFQLSFSYDFATQAYSSGGRTQDISKLVFGEKAIEIQDILLVSKLVREKKLSPTSPTTGGVFGANGEKHYLYLLADQALTFDGSTEKQTANINYARHFAKGDISFGFQVPFVRRYNKLKLTSSLSTDLRNQLRAGNFLQLYNDLEGFLDAVLNKKDIAFHRKDTELGIGDISVFLNFEFDWKRAERLVFGFQTVFPTAKEKNIYKLWDPELGNGGFMQLSTFSSVLFNGNRFLNPHIFAKVTANLPASISQRVPKLISYNGTNPNPGNKVDARMTMGEYAYFIKAENNAITFENYPDTTIQNFADNAKKIKIRPGTEINLRFGNIIPSFLLKNAFLDIFYDFRLKGRDYCGFRIDADEYDSTVLTENTSLIQHRAGLNLSYQFDENFRLNAGALYSFAGRNVPKTAEFNASLNIEF
jgi:hypothetical protein